MSEKKITFNNGLFLFKEAMTSLYNDKGELIPVTVLRFVPQFVSQIKTAEKDGYNAVQLSFEKKKLKNSTKAEIGHLKKAGCDVGVRFSREIRLQEPVQLSEGDLVDLESLKKGDTVVISSVSKGKGFAGSVKRHGFAGGPASHGSKFHRRPGSSGNRTWPGRVMPGKRFPGHMGSKKITVKNVEVVDVLTSENVVLVKGPVPGARNTVVKLVRG